MRDLCQQGELYTNVVNEVNNLIKEEVILINEEGVIVASTDPSRVNDFHEGGLLSIQRKEKMIMTEELTSSLKGVRKGVCLPIVMRGILFLRSMTSS